MMERFLLIGLGGFVGANLRYWLGGFLASRWGMRFPVETLIINVTGSFFLGLLMALSMRTALDPRYRLALGIGLLGGYTTFSTFTWETLSQMERGDFLPALLNILLSVIVGLLAVWLGTVVGRALVRG